MSLKKQRIGEWGEKEASGFLSSLGYEIMARNVPALRGEINLFAKLDDVTVIIKVRTLTSHRIAHPEETVICQKQSHRLAAVEDKPQLHGIDHWHSTPWPSRENRATNRKSLILKTFQDNS